MLRFNKEQHLIPTVCMIAINTSERHTGHTTTSGTGSLLWKGRDLIAFLISAHILYEPAVLLISSPRWTHIACCSQGVASTTCVFFSILFLHFISNLCAYLHCKHSRDSEDILSDPPCGLVTGHFARRLWTHSAPSASYTPAFRK